MGIYLIIYFITMGLVYLSDLTKKRYFFSISTIILCIFSGIRYGIGGDYLTYNMVFKAAPHTPIATYKIGKLFLAVAKIVELFFNNTIIVFFVFAIITTVLLMNFIYKYSEDKWIAFMFFMGLGFYVGSFNIVRQYVAIAISIYALKYIVDKSSKKYYLFILIAAGFHISAIILIPFKFLVERNWTKKFYVFLSACAVVVYFGLHTFLNIIGILIPYYAQYEKGYFVTQGANIMFFVVYFVLLILLFKASKYLDKGINNIFLKFFFIGVLVMLIASKALIIARVSNYFLLAGIPIMPQIFKIFGKKSRRIIIYLAFICLMVYFIYYIQRNGQVLPYRTFLSATTKNITV